MLTPSSTIKLGLNYTLDLDCDKAMIFGNASSQTPREASGPGVANVERGYTQRHGTHHVGQTISPRDQLLREPVGLLEDLRRRELPLEPHLRTHRRRSGSQATDTNITTSTARTLSAPEEILQVGSQESRRHPTHSTLAHHRRLSNLRRHVWNGISPERFSDDPIRVFNKYPRNWEHLRLSVGQWRIFVG